MRRGGKIICLILLGLAWGPAAIPADPDPALKEAETLYRQEGAEAALPRFEALAAQFRAEQSPLNEAMARHFIGECHWRLGNFDASREHLDTALAMRLDLDDKLGIGKTANVLGLLEWDLGNYDQAIARFHQASAIAKELGDRKLEGATLNNVSLIYDELGDYTTSLEQYREVTEIFEQIDFPRGRGAVYGNIGGVHLLLGQFRDALSYYEKSLDVSIELQSKPSMSQDYGNIGLAYLGLGDIDLAIEQFDRAIELAEEAGMRQDVAYWQRGKGNALIRKGRFDEGLAIHRVALEAYEDIGARAELLGALHDMGRLHLSLGDPLSAEAYFQDAISLARDIGNAHGITGNLIALGNLYLRRDELDKAASHFTQARQRAQQINAQSHLAESQLGLAYVHQLQQRYDESAEELDAALSITRSIGARQHEAEATYMIAENERLQERLQEALQLYSAAESILADTGDPDLLWQVYFGRARTLESSGDKPGAIEALRQSVVLIESVRSRLREERFRAGYLQDKYQVYVDLVRLQLEMDMVEEAFQTAERLRARSYSQQFERMAYPLLDEEQQQRERELRERVRQLQRALGEEQRDPSRRQAALQTFSTELVAAEREYQAFLDDQLQPVSTRAASDAIPDSLQIRSQLTAGDVLIEYVVGEQEVMVFALSTDDLFATIEPVRKVDLRSRVELLRDLLSRPGDSRWQRPAESIAQVLIAPLEQAGVLDGASNIYLVPHGILNYLPFAVLPTSTSDEKRLLVDAFTLAHLPTAVSLGEDGPPTSSSPSLLAMAPSSSRLQYAPDEARSINALFEPNSRLLIGDSATESRFKALASDYQVLHLATHSDFNKLNPMFSGLQLEADDVNDGRLEVHEVLRLRLDADLVTLSACDTALGSGYFAEVPAGDEFVGLTRAFLSVGSESVMATLWKVDDRSSVQLMQQFYERLEGPGAYADKSAALMLAQQQLRSTNGYEHPYYWAAFVLVGKMSNASNTRTIVPEASL
jgi:CHAT domain-containing protein